jgi:hypothetical protein
MAPPRGGNEQIGEEAILVIFSQQELAMGIGAFQGGCGRFDHRRAREKGAPAFRAALPP